MSVSMVHKTGKKNIDNTYLGGVPNLEKRTYV